MAHKEGGIDSSVHWADVEIASSLEIDHRLQENVNIFFMLSDSKLRKDYDQYNHINQSLSALLAFNAYLIVLSVPFFVILGLNVRYCETASDWIHWAIVVAWLLALNISSWKVYLDHRHKISYSGSLSVQDRHFLYKFQLSVFLAMEVLVGYRLLAKTMGGTCPDHVNIGGTFKCNPAAESASVPTESAILLMLMPFLYCVAVRGAHFGSTLLLWSVAMGSLIFCIAYGALYSSIIPVVYYGLGSLVILAEVRRLNFFLFFTYKKLQETLKEKERAADEANAQELRHMIANVAHDLKTPLSSFVSGMEVIEQVVADAREKKGKNILFHADVQEHLVTVDSCISNMKNANSFMLMTINRCIDYTKASKGLKLVPKFETVNLIEALALPLNCMRDIQQRIPVRVLPIPFSICSHIITDKQWLQENLLCLLSNAVKYSNEGEVTVGMSLRRTRRSSESAHDAIFISSDCSKDDFFDTLAATADLDMMFRFEVEDHGIGLSEEAMAALFSPFKQAQRLAGGTGLGLFSLAKRIEALEGKCGVMKRRDGLEGSLFWFEIPYRPDISFCMGENDTGMQFLEGSTQFVETKATNEDYLVNRQDLDTLLSLHDPCNGVPSDSRSTDLGDAFLMSSKDGKNLDSPDIFVQKLPSSPAIRLSVHSTSTEVLDILLVDDSPAIIKMTSMMLRRQKHNVTTATNGAEALKVVIERMNAINPMPLHGSFTVILLDLQMPVMDGLETIKRLRRMEMQGVWLSMINQHPSLFDLNSPGSLKAPSEPVHHLVIGVSANSDAVTASEAIRLGMDGFITKPFTLETFYRTFEQVRKSSCCV